MKQENFDWPSYINRFPEFLSDLSTEYPWMITSKASEVIHQILSTLSEDYRIQEGVAIHKKAILESNITMKAPVIIGPDCFIAANCYLRGGVFLMSHNSVGPGCELKSSFIFPDSNLAHFNFVGDSIIGSNVNLEAGSITANYFNERTEREISVLMNGKRVQTHTQKFGALIGDSSKIGANAVLSPGTLLSSSSIVNRLELINQLK